MSPKKSLTISQYEASLCMLDACICTCPEEALRDRVVNLTFSQVAFHAIFYADLYLGTCVEDVRRQPFHRLNSREFGDYEELRNCAQRNQYDRAFLSDYMQHARDKAAVVVAAEDDAALARRAGFVWLDDLSRAELHVYNIRHIQHHAAQLSLWLRQKTGEGVRWVGAGWREPFAE